MIPMVPVAPFMWTAYLARMSGWLGWRTLVSALVMAPPLAAAIWAATRMAEDAESRPASHPAIRPARVVSHPASRTPQRKGA